MNQTKISYKYITGLIFMSIIPTAMLYLPALDYSHAKQDSWIVVLIACIYGLICIYVTTTISLKYPQKTIIEYSIDILGKYLGKVIGFLICCYFIHITAIIIREFTELLSGPFLPQTNILIFSVSIILPSIYAVYKGIEVITRINRIILPIFVISVVSILLLGIKDMDFNNLLPIAEVKITNIFKSVEHQIIWFGEPFILTILFPYINQPQKVRNKVIQAVLLTALLGVINCIAIAATFGARTEFLAYPFLSLTRYTSVGNFLTRMDSLLIIMWVAGVLIKITVFYYCAVISISKLLNLKQYNLPTIPVAMILIGAAYFLWNNITELTNQLGSILILPYTFIQFIIPAILLLVSNIKRRFVHEK